MSIFKCGGHSLASIKINTSTPNTVIQYHAFGGSILHLHPMFGKPILSTMEWHKSFSKLLTDCIQECCITEFQKLLEAFKLEAFLGDNATTDDDFMDWHASTDKSIQPSLRQHFNQLLTELAKTVQHGNRVLAQDKVLFMITGRYAQKNARNWPTLDSLPEIAICANDVEFLNMLLECFEREDFDSYLKTRCTPLICFAAVNGCHETFTLLMEHPKTDPTFYQRRRAIQAITYAADVHDETLDKLQRLVDTSDIEEFLSILVNRERPKCHHKTLPILIAAGGVKKDPVPVANNAGKRKAWELGVKEDTFAQSRSPYDAFPTCAHPPKRSKSH